ncbi:MAG: hypothetical protein CM15mP64_5520 [Candidatus Neomarinimicrobiota bacterium]|nr:MAG: hypothetical protein CM15mP64_5520 [Candidatus Neomarinimicrobiota bacterium]
MKRHLNMIAATLLMVPVKTGKFAKPLFDFCLVGGALFGSASNWNFWDGGEFFFLFLPWIKQGKS